jgi:hypothetical protein
MLQIIWKKYVYLLHETDPTSFVIYSSFML